MLGVVIVSTAFLKTLVVYVRSDTETFDYNSIIYRFSFMLLNINSLQFRKAIHPSYEIYVEGIGCNSLKHT